MDIPIPTQPAKVVVGEPPVGDLKSVTIDQGYPDTCAIRSQEIILRDFGIDVPEDQLRQEAMAHGWYTPGGGTPEADVGKLLELHGVGVTRYEHANIYNLVSDLSAGKRIIFGVDGGELVNPGMAEQTEDSVLGPRPDHALIVAGVDTTNPDDVKVILTDPGTGHVAKEYPLAQFMDAWKDSGCEMVCTNAPAPVTAPGMINFNYDSGHLLIGDMSYPEWAEQYADAMTRPYYSSFDLDGDFKIDTIYVASPDGFISDFAIVDVNGVSAPDSELAVHDISEAPLPDFSFPGVEDAIGTDPVFLGRNDGGRNHGADKFYQNRSGFGLKRGGYVA